MPLITIDFKKLYVSDKLIHRLAVYLPPVAAKELSCEEGGQLSDRDIMIEFAEQDWRNANCKAMHIRVWAHDYPSRRGENLARLDEIRLAISAKVRRAIEEEGPYFGPFPSPSWNVWVLLAPTSYGSDTDKT